MAPEPSPPSNFVQSGLKRRHSSKHLFRPRTFLLSSSLASSSPPIASISGTTRLKSYRKDLAVFMERTKGVPQTQDTLRRTTEANTILGQIGKDTHKGDDYEYGSSEIPATGPIGEGGGIDSSIELSDIVIKPSTWAQDFKESSGGGGPNAKIVEQLHQTAAPPSLISSQSPGAISYKPRPKIKPKPPKPRPQKTPMESGDLSGDDVADGMTSPEGEEDFVYDTYVRSSGQPAGIPTEISEPYQVKVHVDNRKIGILIIPDHDQAVWETFGEEDENDKDWNSEEEDENGTCCREKASYISLLEVANATKPRTFMAMTIRKTKSILMTSLAWVITTIDTVLRTMKNLMKLRGGRMKRVRHNIRGGWRVRLQDSTHHGDWVN